MLDLIAVVILTVHVYSMPVPKRHETCPGATYFIKHGEHTYWTKRMRLLCRIGAHDFYGEPMRSVGTSKASGQIGVAR